MNTTFPTSGETYDENTQKPAPHGRGPRALSPSPWGNDRIRPRHPLPLPTHTVLSALTNLRRRIHANDRGAETLELVIMTPVVLLLIAVIIVGGMVTMAHQKVEHAAAEASRSASLARTISQASTSAKEAATSESRGEGTRLRQPLDQHRHQRISYPPRRDSDSANHRDVRRLSRLPRSLRDQWSTHHPAHKFLAD